jgi:hypothetical protein
MQNVRHTACQQRGGQGFVFTQGPASKYISDCNISHCNYSVEDKIADTLPQYMQLQLTLRHRVGQDRPAWLARDFHRDTD